MNKGIEKTLVGVIWAGLAAIMFTAFIVPDNLFFPFITGKAYYFRIITEIIFFSWVILALFKNEYRPKINYVLITFGLFLISIFFSNLFGANPQASFWSNYERMEGYVTLVHLFGLFLVLGNFLKSKGQWIVLANISIFASLIMAWVALGQVIEEGTINARIFGTLGNSTYLGVYMMFHVFISLFFVFSDWTKNIYLKYLYVIFAIIQTVVVFQTSTRGAILGLFGGIFLTAILIAIFQKENKKLRIGAGVFIGAIIIGVAGLFLLKGTPIVENYQPFRRVTTITISEGTAQARIVNWQIAFEGFKERPILGWGQSNFNLVFDKYYLPEHYGNENWFDRVHNIIFDWLIAGGIFGLLFYLSIFASTLYLIWFKKGTLSINEQSILTGLLAAYFFQNLFVFDQLTSYILFIMILGYVTSQSDYIKLISEKKIPDNINFVLASLVVILIPVTVYGMNAPSYFANRNLLEGMQIVAPNPATRELNYKYENGVLGNIDKFREALSRESFGNGEIRQRSANLLSQIRRINELDENIYREYVLFAEKNLKDQIEENPYDSRYHYLLGTFYANIGNGELAVGSILNAIELSPNKQSTRIPLIKIYSAIEEGEKAIALAKETYELDKSKDDLWFEYLIVLSRFDKPSFDKEIDFHLENSETERVEKFFKRNISLNPDNQSNYISLAAFYFSTGDASSSLDTLDEIIDWFPELALQIETVKVQILNGENPLGESF